MKEYILSLIIRMIAFICGITWRYRISHDQWHPQQNEKTIYLMWHEYLLIGCYFLRRTNLSMLISLSKDGDILAGVLEPWGFRLVRGSSSRGGREAADECTIRISQNENILITPDGPRGPRRVLKKGAARIALNGEGSIRYLHFKPTRSIRLKSWDRFEIPLPFSRIDVSVSLPINYKEYLNHDTPVESMTKDVQNRMENTPNE